MKTIISTLNIIVIIILAGCTNMSEIFHDETAGMNGSFEITKSGLPVNWLLYTPNTVPQGDFQLIIDTVEYKDGKQSLKFLVHECSSTGGWHSPGFAKEYDAIPGKEYKVSFWVKNDGCEFHVSIGGVGPKTGASETIIKSQETIDTWRLIEYKFTVPQEYESMRFSLNILKPGTFWIDDIRIEEIND